MYVFSANKLQVYGSGQQICILRSNSKETYWTHGSLRIGIEPDPNQFKQRQFYTYVIHWSKNVNQKEYYGYYFTEIYLKNSLYLYLNFVLCFFFFNLHLWGCRSSYIFWRNKMLQTGSLFKWFIIYIYFFPTDQNDLL